MDKREFNIKVEQIKKRINEGDYKTAMKIADAIDWRRVRSTNLLSMVAQIYEKNEEYGEAKNILLLAFERAPAGKRLLYKLTDLALKENNIEEAEDYYREFCNLASEDSRQHLLRYMILRAKGAPAEQLVHSLEQYTSEELDEKWMYELAVLYHQLGRGNDCVRLCDKIMVMFGIGKYVDKAMELKLQYAPLTSYQRDLVENRDKYEARLRAVERGYMDNGPVIGDYPTPGPGAYGTAADMSQPYPQENYGGPVIEEEVPQDYRQPEYRSEEDMIYQNGREQAAYQTAAAEAEYEAAKAAYQEDPRGIYEEAPRAYSYRDEQERAYQETAAAYGEGYAQQPAPAFQPDIPQDSFSQAAPQEEPVYQEPQTRTAPAFQGTPSQAEVSPAAPGPEFVSPASQGHPETAVSGDQAPSAPAPSIDQVLEAKMREAEAQENLAREMAKIAPGEEPEAGSLARTKVLRDIREVMPGMTPAPHPEETEPAEPEIPTPAAAPVPVYAPEPEDENAPVVQRVIPQPEEILPEAEPETGDDESEPGRETNHLMIEASTPERGLEMALSALRQIHRELGTKHPIAKISGFKLDKKGIMSVAPQLVGRDLVVEGAGDLSKTVLDELNEFMEQDQNGTVVVLIDTPERMETLHRQNPELACKFECIGAGQEPDAAEIASVEAAIRQQAEKEAEIARAEAARKAAEEARAREAARLAAAEKARAEEQARQAAAEKVRAEEQARLAAAEKARAEEQARLAAAEKARAEEQARREAEERARAEEEEQARLAAEEAAYRLQAELFGEEPEDEEEDEYISGEDPAAYEDAYYEDESGDGYEDEAGEEQEEEMDIDEFAQYACKYAADIDCSITGKSMLALYERIEIMEEEGIPLTKRNAEDLIEEAADKADKPSLGKRIANLFSSKYDKNGLLILKEEHFID